MRTAVIVSPGSNRDMAVAPKAAGADVTMVWHKDATLPDVDLVAVPGGFSFGDYLRFGAIAAQSPVCKCLVAHVERCGYALGVCNGFQVLAETGLLSGALMRNARLKFICKTVRSVMSLHLTVCSPKGIMQATLLIFLSHTAMAITRLILKVWRVCTMKIVLRSPMAITRTGLLMILRAFYQKIAVFLA